MKWKNDICIRKRYTNKRNKLTTDSLREQVEFSIINDSVSDFDILSAKNDCCWE